MTTAFRLRVFGGLRMWREGVEMAIGQPRQRVVLAVLLASRGAVVSTAELVDVLWPEDPPASAVNQVQRLIGHIRRLFEPELLNREPGRWVRPVGDGYRLRLDGSGCDLVSFFDLVASARAALAGEDGRDAVQKYEQALETAQARPFAGLPAGLLELPAFVSVEVARNEAAVEAADLAIGELRARRLLPLLIRYAAGAPLHEPLQARLIRLFAVTGRRAEALVHFEQVRQRLADELGADPGAELMAAHLEALSDPGAPAGHRPAQLPLQAAGFAARDDLAGALEAGRGTGLVVLSGMGGVGKTTLAVDWAHRLAPDFPDGQLFLDLRGFDPSGRYLRPADAVDTLLESIGIAPAPAGDTLDARTARFRSALAGRRMLLLLDNARDSAQVGPLLPGAPGCLVVVTSRNRLPGLVAHQGAWPVHIGRLNLATARDLLVRRLGAERMTAEPAATDELIRLCAGLPLALSIAAARVAIDPAAKLSDVVGDLRSAAHRLDVLETGERDVDVRSAFSSSCALLTEPAARLFRLLAVHPGADASVESIASTAGADVRAALAELTVLNMATPAGAGRVAVHDLLREYATELLDASGGERAPAEQRLVEHYVFGTYHAYCMFRLAPPVDLGPVPPGVFPPPFADMSAAMAWYAAERATLAAVVDLALDRGWARSAALILLHLRPLRSARVESPVDALEQALRVLRAVEDLGDPGLETAMLREVAVSARYPEPDLARALLARALALAERENDLVAQAQLHRNMGINPYLVPAPERLDHLRRAVGFARRAGEPSVLAYALEALAGELSDQGGRTAAAAYAGEAFRVAGCAGMAAYQTVIAVKRAEVAFGAGDLRTSAEMAEWALVHAAPGANYTLVLAGLSLARAALGIGDRERARAGADLFYDTLQQHGDEFVASWGAAEVAEYRTIVDRVVAALGSADGLQ
ncbi:BTAD domain-containing putative transcriptional regulator [Actinoplanes sp. NPDC026619]|uniref:AfsR/SARP family transcriptional regulator n=1 Tax=Actinoplanes sp. NPDC026619 TaxID=3155798 RepID=UPI0033F509CB